MYRGTCLIVPETTMGQLASMVVGRRCVPTRHALVCSTGGSAHRYELFFCSPRLHDGLQEQGTALFVPLCCCQHGSEPAQPNRNPIDLTASAANASGSVQTTLSKLPRPRHQCATASHLGAVPIGIYRLSFLIGIECEAKIHLIRPR